MIVEPIQTFDYRNKAVNRIPLPQRPKWLSETLRGVREFEPLSMRTMEQTRRYNDWRYEERKKYDSYYDERRRFDEPIGRHSDSRYCYEDRRSYERSRSREHDDFNEDNHHGYRSYNRHEERRKYDEDVPTGKASRHEDRSATARSERIDERTRRLEDGVVEVEPVQKPTTASVNMVVNTSKVMLIEDLLSPPGRFARPARIVIILRGPPGSGKTTLAKLIKDKEV